MRMHPFRLVALETSGADSSGLTEAVTVICAVLMFGSRNSMSLCGRVVWREAVCQREAMRRCKIASPVTCRPDPRVSSPSTCYPESRRRALVSRSGEGSALLLYENSNLMGRSSWAPSYSHLGKKAREE